MPSGRTIPFMPRVPSTSDETVPKGETLPQLIERFRANRLPTLAASTQASYRQTFALVEALGDFPSVGQVGVWVTWLRGQYPPPSGFTDSWTVHLHWHNLAALYSWSKEWGFASGCNPAAVLKLPKPAPRARAIVGVADLWPRVLEACHDLRERALLQLALDTGARKGELLGLMPHDLVTTCEPWRLRFERQRPKPDSWATTPLKVDGGNKAVPLVDGRTCELLVELLALGPVKVWRGRGGQHIEEPPFLFPYRNHELVDLRARLGAVAPGVAFGKGDFLHSLRHTFAVELDRSGASVEQTQKALGHRSPQSTERTYINRFARPVDVEPLARAHAARLAGVVKWGAPPGGAGPPAVVASGPGKRTAGVRAPAVQERSKPSSPTITKENTSCRVPSRKSQRALPGLAVSKPKRK
jgi:integrase